MSSRTIHGNVTPLRPRAAPAARSNAGQAQAAEYISQMTRELEALANMAGLELVSYFLAMARAEAAQMAARAHDATEREDQAPYRAD